MKHAELRKASTKAIEAAAWGSFEKVTWIKSNEDISVGDAIGTVLGPLVQWTKRTFNIKHADLRRVSVEVLDRGRPLAVKFRSSNFKLAYDNMLVPEEQYELLESVALSACACPRCMPRPV